MNSEFMAAGEGRGGGGGIYRCGPKAPVGAIDSPVHGTVLMPAQLAPGRATSGCLCRRGHLLPDRGTTLCLFFTIGTGSCHKPVPNILLGLGPGQMYQLLLQPVLMRVSTGYNSSWYLWPRPLAHFLVVVGIFGRHKRIRKHADTAVAFT